MSRNIVFHDQFDSFVSDPKSRVFEVYPSIFKDSRGYFCEVGKLTDRDDSIKWFNDFSWIKQINRSCSKGKTIRGCHAQKGEFCQAKLVQSLTAKIYDIITDARPNSKTFGVTQIFILDPEKQNQLFVPRGFLHAFATVDNKPAIFEYMCDNVFDKNSEIGVSPLSLIPSVILELEKISKKKPKLANDFFDLFMLFRDQKNIILSEKDLNAYDYTVWMSKIQKEYNDSGKVWYK